MFTHTSTEWAPWYVIPADRKWFARVAAAAVIANALIEHRSAVPDPRRGRAPGPPGGQAPARGRGARRRGPRIRSRRRRGAGRRGRVRPTMAARFVAAIDHGTTSTRCILFTRDGTPAAIAQREQTMYYPRPGWVELDMERGLAADPGVHPRGARHGRRGGRRCGGDRHRERARVRRPLGPADGARGRALDHVAGHPDGRRCRSARRRRRHRPVPRAPPACRSRRTRRRSSCSGCSTRSHPGAPRRSAATCCSERRTRGCCGT